MASLRKLSAIIIALTAASISLGTQQARNIAQINAPVAPTYFATRMVELNSSNNGHFITIASINNRPLKVMVDTGATAVALSYEDANKTGLYPHLLKFDAPVSTANGVIKAAKVKIDRVEIDNILIQDVEGLVLPKGAMNGTLLGMSFLSRLTSFSYRDGKLIMKN